MVEPMTAQEAIEALKQGMPVVLIRTDQDATYMEHVHGEYIQSTYNNVGQLTKWCPLNAKEANNVITNIFREKPCSTQ